MGTKGFVVFKYKGIYYVFYNNSDSYLEHLCNVMINDIKEMIKIKLKNKSNYNLANCITIDLRIPEPFIEVTLCVKFPLKITSIFG